ncbi:MAG: hypothetical protein WA624_08135, partial [Methylocella sp.]
WQTLPKAVCHGESDKCRFGNPPQESNFQRLGIIRLVSKMAAQVELADRGRFDLPINAGSKLRPHRD